MSDRGYVGQVFEVRPILERMEDRGVPIDDSARIALEGEFDKAQEEMLAEIQKAVPVEALRLHPKDGYKGTPPEAKVWLANKATLGASPYDMVQEKFYEERFKEPADDGEWYHYAHRKFAVPVVDATTGDPVLQKTLRWCRVYDFNPNSPNQVKAYIKAKGHPVPKDRRREDELGENPETTAEGELRKLASKTGDLFYLKVIEYRGLTKMRGTYIKGFEPGDDGRVHTTFTFDTGIGQLSSRNPNVQNFPKLKPTVALAKAMRRMICAPPGHIITEWDFKSCHVITLGFLAEDLNYMRLGRLDIHSFVAGHFLGLWDGLKIFNETDEQLLARFKELKKNPEWKRVRDDQAKHGILGIGNGLKAKGLWERYMGQFPSQPCEQCGGGGMVPGIRKKFRKCPSCRGYGIVSGFKTAVRVLEVCGKLFPKVFAYQEREAQAAHDAIATALKGVRTPFGHIRRFYEVFKWNHDRGDWGPGDQHEEAIAYRLANIAFGHIREKLKVLAAKGYDECYGLFNNVHDSFMFCFPEELLEQHVADIYPVLVSPSPVLKNPVICPDGLVIGVEGSWGRRWSDMNEIEIPKDFGSTIRPKEAVA